MKLIPLILMLIFLTSCQITDESRVSIFNKEKTEEIKVEEVVEELTTCGTAICKETPGLAGIKRCLEEAQTDPTFRCPEKAFKECKETSFSISNDVAKNRDSLYTYEIIELQENKCLVSFEIVKYPKSNIEGKNILCKYNSENSFSEEILDISKCEGDVEEIQNEFILDKCTNEHFNPEFNVLRGYECFRDKQCELEGKCALGWCITLEKQEELVDCHTSYCETVEGKLSFIQDSCTDMDCENCLTDKYSCVVDECVECLSDDACKKGFKCVDFECV